MYYLEISTKCLEFTSYYLYILYFELLSRILDFLFRNFDFFYRKVLSRKFDLFI